MRGLRVMVGGLVGLSLMAAGAVKTQAQTYIATLSGQDASPPVSTGAVGAATVATQNGSFTYTLEVGGIKDVTSACIHISKPELAVIMLYGGPEVARPTGVLTSGTLTAKDLGGLTSEQFMNALKTGEAVISVHTAKYPGGEIQGTLAPEPKRG
ncbi:MAG: CHRD domain-containing protein [Gemmatimonadetes bacterium]|nr:CHRD domain-containing protein [Gemmatimonadota bacterium]